MFLTQFKNSQGRVFALLLAGLLLGSVGCSSSAANTVEVEAKGQPVIRTVNPSFASYVSIDNAQGNYIDGVLEVVVTLSNLDTEEARIEYQYRWYDRDGIVINDTTRLWSPDVLDAKDTKQLKSLAPKPGAVKCKFLVRPPLDD